MFRTNPVPLQHEGTKKHEDHKGDYDKITLPLRASALKSPTSGESFLTQRKQSGGDAEGAGLGWALPRRPRKPAEPGIASRRLARRPLPVLASKLADGKDPRANPAGFPTRRTRKPACGGTRKPHGTRLEKCVDALFLKPPVGHVYEGAVAPQ